jgi:hypothetical protein
MPYAKKRNSVFSSVLTPINTDTQGSNQSRKHNWFKNATQENKSLEKIVNNVEIKVEKVCNDECCSFEHLSKLKLSVNEKL